MLVLKILQNVLNAKEINHCSTFRQVYANLVQQIIISVQVLEIALL